MEIYRVEFHDSSHRLAKCVPTGEDVRSNFLEDELAGCVLGTANSNYEIIAVDWRTGMTARIDTGIPKQVKVTAVYLRRFVISLILKRYRTISRHLQPRIIC